MITIASTVHRQLEQRPILRMLIGSELINIRAVAKEIRSAVEAETGVKVGLEAIAIALHREAEKVTNSPLDSILTNPDIKLLTTYHGLIALNYPKGFTGAETIPDTVRYFAQTTGSSEHSVVISEEDAHLLDTSKALGRVDNLSALCLGLPKNSADIESLYASIFLFFGLQGIAIVEVVSTFNELTLIIRQGDYARAYGVLGRVNQACP